VRFSLACSSEEGNSSLFQTRPGSYSSAGLLRANKADDLLRARLRTVYVEAPPVFIGCCGVLTPCHTHPIWLQQLLPVCPSSAPKCAPAYEPIQTGDPNQVKSPKWKSRWCSVKILSSF
jgi:hypothetical protein